MYFFIMIASLDPKNINLKFNINFLIINKLQLEFLITMFFVKKIDALLCWLCN